MIILEFSIFSLEGIYTSACDFDRLTIFDGPSVSSPVMDILCGTIPNDELSGGRMVKQWNSTANTMLVQLASDSVMGLGGFSAEYHAVVINPYVPDIIS